MANVVTLGPKRFNCTEFMPYHSRHYWFYAINVVVIGILCGIGIIGNLFNIVVLSRRNYSHKSVIFVFLGALAVADTITLLLWSPIALSDADVFPPEINYSKFMAYFHVVQYGVCNILKHAATWIIVTVAVLRHLAIYRVFQQTDTWLKRNRGRLLVLIIFLVCTMLDMPRFFELKVSSVPPGHCYYNLTVYYWTYSDFSRHKWYRKIYPWIASGACYLLPLFLVLVFNIMIIWRLRTSNVKRREMAPGTQRSRRQQDHQTTKMLVVVMLVFLFLELPDAIAHVLVAINPVSLRSRVNYAELIMVANMLSLVHSSITFLLYSAMSSEFRKVFKNTFCCLCLCCCKDTPDRTVSRTGSYQTVTTSRRSSGSSAALNGTIPRGNTGTLLTNAGSTLPRDVLKGGKGDMRNSTGTPIWI